MLGDRRNSGRSSSCSPGVPIISLHTAQGEVSSHTNSLPQDQLTSPSIVYMIMGRNEEVVVTWKYVLEVLLSP
jgi:hypothetical protein